MSNRNPFSKVDKNKPTSIVKTKQVDRLAQQLAQEKEDFSLYSPIIDTPNIGFIDEESLLPGAMEPKDFNGLLDIEGKGKPQFKPLVKQDKLIGLNLTSHGQPLYYTLNDDQTELNASRGANGPIVFTAILLNDGTYSFKLFDNIDREQQPNLINNGNFEGSQYICQDKQKCLLTPGWELLNHVNDSGRYSEYQQSINTSGDQMYQVTFYYSAHKASKKEVHPIKVFWNRDHLMTLDQSKTDSHGYTFSVLGNDNEPSQLRFICQDDEIIRNYLSNISVMSRAQSTVPIILAFTLMGLDETLFESEFKINVTTTPPLEINNESPIDVMFEQSVYQTIVITDENKSSDPFAKINLDSVFESLNVAEDDRVVQIVQREEDGIPTNVYEVQVSDRNNDFSPITVADVKLSFPGGDAGLSIFLKNIHIDEV